MTERQLQFRVGLLVLAALAVATVLTLQFSDLRKNWQKTYALAIQFDEAPGLQKGTPVTLSGVKIGRVDEVRLADEGGVLAVVHIQQERQLRKDARASLVRSILGDSTITFSPGINSEHLPPNAKIKGSPPSDPLQIVERLDVRLNETLTAFAETSREWQQVAANVNALIETRQGRLDDVIERTALALEQFTQTMHAANGTLTSANNLLADPELQESLRVTVAALPQMVNETRGAISAARTSIEKIGTTADELGVTLATMNQVADPLARKTPSIVTKLDSSLGQLEVMLGELATFSKVLNNQDGTLQRAVSDPRLYDDLSRSAAAMQVVLRNLEMVSRDIRVFSDKVARHPEVLGIRGAIQGSSGLKEIPEGRSMPQPIQPAEYSTPGSVPR